ncbi:MAG: glucohydrolase [Cellulomonas sp. 73-92]|uniref:glycoside hydrolase family 13 protein n=1 Tax=Cellulomonas sp. 73-92 TaxID=1895740 RepID=UPI0009294FEE|nr:alpha-glucosidase [Cellulomonas sp. 73-92]OJV80976.1 MAG: glucohydrolase [Cellulomonas sp. 73-92]
MSRPWWRSAVVYQVYPRSFADSDGDGIGDLRGVVSRLDHLAALGVDAVWLSPVYRSPHADNGYDISDYQDVDPMFGTLADLDELIAEAHRRGIRIVLDLVVNHTSDEHPWFVASRSSADDPKRDWYWWRPARPGATPGEPGAEPTNWSSFFSGPTWTWDEATGEYYLHLFATKQPDLNWENPQVREAVHAMMRWWLDRGIDGFRMDVINFIAKDPDLPDGPVPPGASLGDGFAHYATRPRVHELLAEMRREVFDGAGRELMTVGEMPGVTREEARLFTDPARGELDMVFQFEHVSLDQGQTKFDPVPLALPRLKANLAAWQEGLGAVGWNSLYWSNHDQPRAVSRFGDDVRWWRESATALATVLHLHRGTPFVYQGEELGMTNAPWPDVDAMRDIEARNFYAEAVACGADRDRTLAGLRNRSRDNARTPMQWDAGPGAGFTDGTPWLPVNPNHVWLNAASQVGVPGSVFEHYRALIALRHDDPVVVDGDFTLLLPDDPAVWAFTRTLAGRPPLLVAANCSGEERDVRTLLAGLAGAELVLGNLEGAVAGVLRPWEAQVLRLAG